MRITKKLKTFYIQTLGCKTNQSESDDIFNVLANKRYRSVELKNRPDFVILNTCTVTSLADKKARQLMGRVRKESPD